LSITSSKTFCSSGFRNSAAPFGEEAGLLPLLASCWFEMSKS
jgi:hypothetical protein